MGENKLPMGGNSGIYYGTADFGENIPENQTEFEFLTGINLKYLNTSSCYGEYYSLEQESMVSYMESSNFIPKAHISKEQLDALRSSVVIIRE